MWASTSLMTTSRTKKRSGPPGEPFSCALATQLLGLFGEENGSTSTSELPKPAAAVGHGAASSYVTERTITPDAFAKVNNSP